MIKTNGPLIDKNVSYRNEVETTDREKTLSSYVRIVSRQFTVFQTEKKADWEQIPNPYWIAIIFDFASILFVSSSMSRCLVMEQFENTRIHPISWNFWFFQSPMYLICDYSKFIFNHSRKIG